MERIIVRTWRVMNILLCLLLIGYTGYSYLTMISCGLSHVSDLFFVLVLLIIPFLGCGYHLYRLSRPRNPEGAPSGLLNKTRTFLFIPAELCVPFAAWPILFVTAMGPGEQIYFYENALGSNYASVIYKGEREYLNVNGVYTDRLEDVFSASPGLQDWAWLGPKGGYETKVSVNDGGKRFTAVVVAGPKRKLRRDGYFVDESGTVRTAPEGTTPGKDSRIVFRQ